MGYRGRVVLHRGDAATKRSQLQGPIRLCYLIEGIQGMTSLLELVGQSETMKERWCLK